MKAELESALYDLEYAAFNLCEDHKKEKSLDERIVESTCPETSLILGIRKIKKIIEMKSFPNTNTEPHTTRYSDFKKLIEDWNVSEHFKYRMRQALTSADKVAEFDRSELTTNDKMFMARNGYVLNDNMTTEV